MSCGSKYVQLGDDGIIQTEPVMLSRVQCNCADSKNLRLELEHMTYMLIEYERDLLDARDALQRAVKTIESLNRGESV
jgi:hypothetical protein